MTRWIAAGGAFVVSLDSMVNIAFPSMAAAFALAPEQTRWVIIAYVLAYAVMSFVGGAAGDRLGHARVFRAGLAGTAVAYVVAGSAPTFGWLLAGRVLQGIAGGLVYGSAPALVMLGVAASARGRAAGFVNAAISLAFAVGPVMAGDLVARFGWRAVFYARLPAALAVMAWTLVAPPARLRLGPATVSAADVLRAPVLGTGALAFLAFGGMFAVWLLTPFDLVERRGFDARAGGLLFALTPLGMALGAMISGRMTDRVGPRGPVLVGLAVEAAALAVLGAARATTPVAIVAAALLGVGLGVGVFQVPNMASLMAQFAPAHQGAGGGFVFLARTLGIVGGVATFGLVFRAQRAAAGVDAAFSTVFLVAAGLVALAAAAAACAILAAVCRRPTGGSSSRSP